MTRKPSIINSLTRAGAFVTFVALFCIFTIAMVFISIGLWAKFFGTH